MKVPLKVLLGNAGRRVKKNSPHILVAAGIVSMVGAVVTAVKVTPKAKELIASAEEEKGEKLTPVETVKATWKCYALPAGCMIAGAACIIGADVHNTKVNAGLMTTATVAETALKTYQEKVIETLGENEEKKIRESARKDISENKSLPQESAAILGGRKVHCIDCLGNEYYADPDDVYHAVNVVNNEMNDSDYASLNELYYEIPEAHDTVIGSYIGWNRTRDGLIKAILTPSEKNKELVWLVTYDPLPDYHFDSFK